MPREEIHVEGRTVDVHLLRVAPVRGEPVILVPGLAAAPRAYELNPVRSLVSTLHARGRTPWLVDFQLHWRSNDQGADALLHALEVALSELRRHIGDDLEHVDAVGHSLGGILLLALAADGVPLRRIVTLASALDYRNGKAPLPRLLSLAPRGLRPLRPGFRRGGLPTTRIATMASSLFGRDLGLPVERDQYHADSTPPDIKRQNLREGVRDIPLALLLDLADLFTEEGLHLGAQGRPLREAVGDLRQPVLMVAARQDRQCPLEAVRAAARRIPGARLLEVGGEGGPGEGYGHVDVLTGARAAVEVFDPVADFLGPAAAGGAGGSP